MSQERDMQKNELSDTALREAACVVGTGPVAMVNLLSFREQPVYPADFADKKTSARSAYYEGYGTAFREIAAKLGISTELVYAGKQIHGLLVEEGDCWDDIVIVRYRSLADLQKILESEDYATRATPHRLAAIADWRFIATGGY
jgi:uncharacterized protein (DUF1330 family)